jgi:23S rRNA (adenine2503-C2)-methyltransferase
VSERLPGLLLDELSAALRSRTRALAVLRSLHAARPLPAALPSRIDGVSDRAWDEFRGSARWKPPRVVDCRVDGDGTTKYALAFGSTTVETVRIPGHGRSTVCVSSQAGCTRRCAFCATATVGFERQLGADEIVMQVMVARADAPAALPVKNVVFMGMGEPMDNLDAVLRAVRVLTQPPAPQLRAAAVTVSTAGVLPGLRRFLRECPASLALSLNAADDETRARLMPHGRVWPIADLLAVLREDGARNPRRVHFIEYVLLAGVNDGAHDAEQLRSSWPASRRG